MTVNKSVNEIVRNSDHCPLSFTGTYSDCSPRVRKMQSLDIEEGITVQDYG